MKRLLTLFCVQALLRTQILTQEDIAIQRKRLHFCGCDVATYKEQCLLYDKCYWIQEKCVPEGSELTLYVAGEEEMEEELQPLFPDLPEVPQIIYKVIILNEEEVEYVYYEENAEESNEETVVVQTTQEPEETIVTEEEIVNQQNLELLDEEQSEETNNVEFQNPFDVETVKCNEFKEQEQCEKFRWPYKFFCIWQDEKCQDGTCENLTSLQCEKTFFCVEYGRCEQCLPPSLDSYILKLILLILLILVQ